MGGALPDERIVRLMEIGVAGYRYDRRGVFPGELDDETLTSIGCPALLLVGDQEMIYDPVAAVERARRCIPDCEAQIIPGVGHPLGMQRPDLVNDLILDFLGAPAAVPA
jgi:pimeloyl-ACP methyl ester carboxylesterase